MTRKYKSRAEAPKDPYRAQPLPTNRPVAVYYRQSSEAQIGNISTTLQTVDMVEHLVHLGWAPESVIMIDMDGGISGQKTIAERPGMSQLVRLIEAQEVGAVAAQDVDRFFRDVTQIQTNLFIDACRRNNVLVLTPNMVFDFNHPTQGRYHMQMFRDQAERAADYLEYHIRGRLVKARHWRSERGMWAGRKIAAGYIVDDRTHLPTGERNPDYRKYIPFEPYAAVIRSYYKLFQEYNGCVEHTWQHIQKQGPFFPEFTEEMIPEGFKYKPVGKHRSAITGKLCPAKDSLRSYLTNVAYIGHWVHKGTIVEWDNHAPIVEYDLFMYAFNSLSATNFHGEPNPDYSPYRAYQPRQPRNQRSQPHPTYAGLLFSDDLEGMPHRRLAAIWNEWNQEYQYNLYIPSGRGCVWCIRSKYVDPVIDAMLLDRLQATTLDESLWAAALHSSQEGNFAEIRRIEGEIKHEKQAQDNIIASLGKLTNDEMILRAQANYEAAARRIKELVAELEHLRTADRRAKTLLRARPALIKIVEHWDSIPSNERRNIFQEFARFITLTRLNRATKRIQIHWRDGSISEQLVMRHTKGFLWEDEDLALLKTLIEGQAEQADILKAFPERNWRQIRDIYMYHYGNDRRFSDIYNVYGGKKRNERRYRNHECWEDTDEYKGAFTELATVGASTDRLK
ncbi:MAG: recombinase family protein [Anaerolineae bacterium]|nr:recombinase family protein [Anaerolineae bacterium]